MANKGDIGAEIAAAKPPRPLYIRLPRAGTRCPYTDLPRSTLKDLCVSTKANNYRPPVRSISLKKSKHAKRGVRLIDYQSLIAYLRREFAKAG
jgi:hypothetical protein